MKRFFLFVVFVLLCSFIGFNYVNADDNLSKIKNIINERKLDEKRTLIIPYNNGSSIVLIGQDLDYVYHLYELDAKNGYEVINDLLLDNIPYLNKVYFQKNSLIFCALNHNNIIDIIKYEDKELRNIYNLISIDYFNGLLEYDDKLIALGTNNGKIERLVIENGVCSNENLEVFIPELSVGVSRAIYVDGRNKGIPYFSLTLRDEREIFLEASGNNHVISNSAYDEKSIGQLGEKIYKDKTGTLIIADSDLADYKNKQVYFFNGKMKNMLGNIFVDNDKDYKPLFPKEKLNSANVLGIYKNLTLVYINSKSRGNNLVCIDNITGDIVWEIKKDDLPKFLNIRDDLITYINSEFFNFFVSENKCYISCKNYDLLYYGEYDLNTKNSEEILYNKESIVNNYDVYNLIYGFNNFFIYFVVIIFLIAIILFLANFKKIIQRNKLNYLLKNGEKGLAIVNCKISKNLYSVQLVDQTGIRLSKSFELKENRYLADGDIVEVIYDSKKNIAIIYGGKHNSNNAYFYKK